VTRPECTLAVFGFAAFGDEPPELGVDHVVAAIPTVFFEAVVVDLQ
jgi:hypothetical protein